MIANPAYAGFFSFIGDLTTDNAVEYLKQRKNAYFNNQDAPLLSAAFNVNPKAGRGGAEVIATEGALVAPLTPDPSAIGESLAPSDIIYTYIVRPGDTISEIADMYGVTTNTIRWANDITRGDTIRISQELIILPTTGVAYEVLKGDTLASIAKKYKADLQEVANYNEIDKDAALSVGDKIIIPEGIDTTWNPKPVTGSTQSYVSNITDNGSKYYIRPVRGVLTQDTHGLNAIDIGADIGTRIVAAASGEVIIAKYSGWNGGLGNYVVIQHPAGSQTVYAHMNTVEVVKGQWVIQGARIGTVGNSGKSTGPHVHFGVRGGPSIMNVYRSW